MSTMKIAALWLILSLWAGLAPAGTHHYYYTDAQGTVLARANASGAIVATYDYAPYGTAVTSMSPAPNGPGYTGHVNDPESGLVYMQARYYDVGTGLFLNVDPIRPEPGNLFNLSRYGYANSNPVRYIDLDGRSVQVAFEDDRARMGAVGMAIYLALSPTFRNMYSRLDNSKINYVLMFGHSTRDRYLPGLKHIYINPELGYIIKSSGEVQSPAVGASHEIAHAFDNDVIGDDQFAKDSKTPVADAGGKVIPKDDVEEERATRLENSVAKELGEPTRKSYTDVVKSVITCSPTSRKVCGN